VKCPTRVEPEKEGKRKPGGGKGKKWLKESLGKRNLLQKEWERYFPERGTGDGRGNHTWN